jgi:predicted RNA-binding Zn-ribbon protein involved in translation (DUF1610 family)
MEGSIKEKWCELCDQAASEQDYERFLEIVVEINKLLNEKERLLANDTRDIKQFHKRRFECPNCAAQIVIVTAMGRLMWKRAQCSYCATEFVIENDQPRKLATCGGTYDLRSAQ